MNRTNPALQRAMLPKHFNPVVGTIFPWQNEQEKAHLTRLPVLNLNQTNLITKPTQAKRFVASPPPSEAFLSESSNLVEQKPLDQRVYELLADAKIKTRLVGNHLPKEWQSRLFHQLDQLHEIDMWEPGDLPMLKESFDTFLSMMLIIRPSVRPGLSLTHDGNILGTWGTKDDYITISFLPNRKLRWSILRTYAGELIRSTSFAPAEGFEQYLEPYDPSHWWYRNAKP
jgi:hypothetical protein